MNSTHTSRIPVCLVTGFLGAGKTTLLKNIVDRNRDRLFMYLVNEFSPHDIDGAIVQAEDPRVIAIPGGSIFCRCLTAEFISQFAAIPDRLPGVEGVVVEASGMANPMVMGDMLRDSGLDEQYTLAHVISLVDPASFGKLRATLPNITAQIEAADTVLINKIDLHDASEVDALVNDIEAINPRAAVERCTYGDVKLDLFAPHQRELHGEYAMCRDPNFEAYTTWPHSDISVQELASRLVAAGDDVYRAKGYVNSDGRSYYVDFSPSGFTSHEETRRRDSAVVLIMRREASEAGRELSRWLAGKRI